MSTMVGPLEAETLPIRKPKSRLRKWLVRGLKGLAGLVILACLVGSAYQGIELRRDNARLPAPGRMVGIGTHKLHLLCEGEGLPMVLLDAGAGTWSVLWKPVQDQLAKHNMTCSFDRSGLGWSERGPHDNDGLSSSRELHELVENAGLPRPFIYVGHSLGGDLAQIYYGNYPSDLAGLVLIDPGYPKDLLEDFQGDKAAALKLSGCGWKCGAARVATTFGITRLATHWVGSTLMTPDVKEWYRTGLSKPAAAATIVETLQLLPKTAYQVLAVEDYRNVPLTIVYSENTRRPDTGESAHDVEVWHAGVLEAMRELASRSTRGRGPIVIKGATHGSIVMAPAYAQQVANEVETQIAESRVRK